MTKKTISFIGCGNMGGAILDGIAKDFRVFVCEQDKARVASLKKKYHVTAAEVQGAVADADIILLAVKPQDFETILVEVKKYLKPSSLVVSIAAGITTKFIEKTLGGRVHVVRVMPNLPAKVGEGMAGVAAGRYASTADVKAAVKIFESIGRVVVVDEKSVDAVTAVSGSGPAYVFLFAELLTKSAKKLGLPETLSRTLVMQTLKGSLKLLEQSGEDAAVLRGRVTSKGGTTQAALDVFFANKIDAIFTDALSAAKKRAKELSK